MPTFQEKLNEQIAYEFAASQQYIAIAVHYDAETLPQLAAHFYRQAVEERNHAMMMVQYLLDSGDDVMIPAVAAPQVTFADDIAPVALALDQEKRVTAQISELAVTARERPEISLPSSSCTGSYRSSARRSRRCRRCCRSWSGSGTT